MAQTHPPSSDNFFPHTDKFLLEVLDSLGHPFYVVDAESYEILVANRALGPAPPPGMTCHEWFQRSTKPCGTLGNDCPVDKARKARAPVVVDHTHFDERGQLRHTEVHAHPMFDAAGNVFRVIEYSLDVTDRKLAQESLREQRDFIAAVLDTTSTLVVVLDPHGRIVRFNRACEELTGRSSDEMAGTTIWNWLLLPAEVEQVKEVLARLCAGQFPIRYENSWFVRDNQRRYIDWSNTALLDERGSVSYVISTGMDITERRQAEVRLKALNESLEERVAQRTRDAETQAAQLRRLAIELTQVENRERHRLAAVLHDDVQQLLLGARLRVAAAQREFGDTAVQNLLRAADDAIGGAISTCRSLSVELAPPVLSMSGLTAALMWLGAQMQERFGLNVAITGDNSIDPRDEDVAILVFQAVRELLVNVVKHAQVPNAMVTMTGVEGQRLEIIVEDSGVGFDPCNELQAVAAPETLGLFSVGERLKLLGGDLIIESSPGQGTRAILTAPQRDHNS